MSSLISTIHSKKFIAQVVFLIHPYRVLQNSIQLFNAHKSHKPKCTCTHVYIPIYVHNQHKHTNSIHIHENTLTYMYTYIHEVPDQQQ